jgi:hypothetical protein
LHTIKFLAFLVTAFRKNENENLSMEERNALKNRADNIVQGLQAADRPEISCCRTQAMRVQRTIQLTYEM